MGVYVYKHLSYNLNSLLIDNKLQGFFRLLWKNDIASIGS